MGGQIWSGDKLVYQVVYEKPEYIVTKQEPVCKTFFKRPSFMATFNSTGDLVKSKGKISTPPTKMDRHVSHAVILHHTLWKENTKTVIMGVRCIPFLILMVQLLHGKRE